MGRRIDGMTRFAKDILDHYGAIEVPPWIIPPACLLRRGRRMDMVASAARLWWYIDAYIERVGFPPTIHEAARALFVAPSTALRHYDFLCGAGVIERWPNGNRSTRLLVRWADRDSLT